MEQIIARRDPNVLLVQVGQKQARVLDRRRKRYYPPDNLQSILARGYWMRYDGSAAELAEAKVACGYRHLAGTHEGALKSWEGRRKAQHPRDGHGRFAVSESDYEALPRSSVVETPAFKAWFGDSQVVDADGKPLVMYHGTTADFRSFDSNKANPEADFGAGFYFSNNPADVESNYAGIGPDLEGKIETEASQVGGSYGFDADATAQVDDWLQAHGVTGKPTDTQIGEAARALATEKFVQHEGETIPVFLKLEHPAVFGGKDETHLTDETEFNEDGDAVNEKGTLFDFMSAVRDEASRYNDGEAEDVLTSVFEQGDGVTLREAVDLLRKDESFSYYTDDHGRLVAGEIVRAALARMGFDGIIDRTVDQKFGSHRRVGKQMEGVDEGTVHVIAFSPYQIKSALGNQTFNPHDPRIDMADDADWDEAKHPRDAGGKFATSGSTRADVPTPVGADDWKDAPILSGVQFAENAEALFTHFRDAKTHEASVWNRDARDMQTIPLTPTPDDIAKADQKIAEAEAVLRELPLLHGTTVAGAISAVTGGLTSFHALEPKRAEFQQDYEDLKKDISARLGDDMAGEQADDGYLDYERIREAWPDLDPREAQAVANEIADLHDLNGIISGHTYPADAREGLDRFVFLSHGEPHPDYGQVSVIVDNALVKTDAAWATPTDIVNFAPDSVDERFYPPKALEAYKKQMVKGADYFKVAAAQVGDPSKIPAIPREKMWEVKVPRVPKSAVLGIMVRDDYDLAIRLRDHLDGTAAGAKMKVLFVSDSYGQMPNIQHQLRTLQRTGGWDEDAVEQLADNGHEWRIL
jgi:hypothetical protein